MGYFRVMACRVVAGDDGCLSEFTKGVAGRFGHFVVGYAIVLSAPSRSDPSWHTLRAYRRSCLMYACTYW